MRADTLTLIVVLVWAWAATSIGLWAAKARIRELEDKCAALNGVANLIIETKQKAIWSDFHLDD